LMVLAFAFLVVVSSEASAARVAATKISGLNGPGVLPSKLSTAVRVPAVKNPPNPPSLAANAPGQASNNCGGMDCNQLHGALTESCACPNGATIVGNLDINSGVTLDVGASGRSPSPTLVFDDNYVLKVKEFGTLKIHYSTVQTNSQPYSVTSEPGSRFYLEKTTITGAAEFTVNYALSAEFYGVRYHDNGAPLTITGSAVIDGDAPNPLVSQYSALTSMQPRQRGYVQYDSQYYNNGGGAQIKIVNGGGRIKNSEVYGSGNGKGVYLKNAFNVWIEGNSIHDNGIGVYLENSMSDTVVRNTISGNSVAGVEQFIPHEQEGGNAVDNIAYSLNALSNNTITGNGDGVVIYARAMQIDSPGLVSGNTRYGFVSVDVDLGSSFENSIGSNGAGKAAHLHSMRVGGIVYNGNMPTNPVYVTFCKGDIPTGSCEDYTGTRNDAYRYDDYLQSYTTSRRSPPYQMYFTSDLVASEENTFQGNHGLWTPRFLVYQHTVDNGGNYLNSCDGNPDRCQARAVTVYDSADFGNTQFGMDPSPQFEYTFIEMYHDMLKGGKKQVTPVVQPALKSTKRLAVKIAVPEIRAVKTVPFSAS